MSVVSLEEVEPFLPVTLTLPQQNMVEDLIDLVEGELSEILNRPIEPQQFVETRTVNLTEPTLFLQETPVISIDAVVADGNAVDPGMYTQRSWGLDFGGFNTLAIVDPVIWTPSNAHFTWWQTPDVLLLASGDYPQSIWVVTYTAGLDGRNDNLIRSVLIKAIRREIGEIFQGFSSNYTSMKVEDYAWTKDPRLMAQMVGSFSPSEISLLDHHIHKNYAM